MVQSITDTELREWCDAMVEQWLRLMYDTANDILASPQSSKRVEVEDAVLSVVGRFLPLCYDGRLEDNRIGAYLVLSTKRECYEVLKQASRGTELREDFPDPNRDNDPEAITRSKMPDIQSCLDKLSPVQRQAFLLHHWHERPQAEVAQIQSAPLGTVKSRIFTARDRLRKCLETKGYRYEN